MRLFDSRKLPLITGSAGAALLCLCLVGWTAYSHRSERPPVPSVYAIAPYGAVDPADEVSLALPSPVAQAPAAPAAPAMAYSEPTGRRGTFVPPMGGYVVQPFGPTDFTLEPPFTYHGTTYPHFHTGIDIDAPTGTPVGASAAGVVLQIGVSDGEQHGYGNYVLIGHRNGYATLYGHLERVVVIQGQQVKQLELIGYSGSTGMSTGPHLHFEIRHYGDFEDPLPYLLRGIRAW